MAPFSYLFSAVHASLHSVPSRNLAPVQLVHSVDEGPVQVSQVPSQASQVLVTLFSNVAPEQDNLQIPACRYLPVSHLLQFKFVGPLHSRHVLWHCSHVDVEASG